MDTTIKSLTGITGFLNGQSGLHDMEEQFSKNLIKNGKEIMILDNLFEEPKKLMEIKKCNNIVLSTTGMYTHKLDPLMKKFEKMKYTPKVVIFGGENTALYFVGVAREFKKKGTEFYFFSMMDFKRLFEICWI